VTALDTSPAYFELASPEIVPLSIDVSNWLGQGDTLQSCTCTITDVNTGQDLSATMLFGTPQIAGNVITQVVEGAVSGEQYYLVGTFTIGANKKLSFRMRLIADF